MTPSVRLPLAFVVAIAACSPSSGGQGAPAPAACGNGVWEAGEPCDGIAVPNCAQATGDPLATGVVACVGCRLDLRSCRLGAGASGPNGAGLTSGGGFGNSAVVGTGGVTGAGGFMAVGGTVGGGNAPANGGLTGASGSVGNGGLPGSGGFPGPGGFIGTGGSPATGGMIGTGGAPIGGTTSSGGSSATGGNSSTGPLGDVNALRQACVDTINQYRATLSLPPLSRATATVETCSDTGAQSDATSGVAHQSSGKCPGMGAQDTCPGWNPQQYGGVENALKACLKGMWAEGDPPEGRTQCINEYFAGNTACFLAHGHYLNMSSTDNTVVSCGFYVMPNGDVWMNQDFGN